MSQIKKLIEVALPLEAINAESAREKSIRHGHPSTLHLWWARRPLAAARAVTPEQEAEIRRRAAEYIPQRVAVSAPLVGVTPTGIKITSAQKRFGSCSGRNSLCFSWRLMQYPPAAIDYVVVHELCHIRHHDHSAAFWAAVARVMPDYKQRQALLRG